MIEVPAQLQHAIRQLLHQYPSQQWSDAARLLSERYRATRDGSSLLTSALDTLAYSAMILPATYAQAYRAIQMTLPHIDISRCQNVLDIGSGPGTVLWALHTLAPHISERTGVERDTNFIEIAQHVCQQFMGTTTFIAQDITTNKHWQPHDLVVIGHVLNELSPAQRANVITEAWQATRNTLIIIEPGTSEFFTIIQQARQQLITLGAHIAAPCTHHADCRMGGDDWCHFGQKIARPDFQRHARAVQVGWEESKVSFVAATRYPAHHRGQRVIHDPTLHKGYIELSVCNQNGIQQHHTLKRNKAEYSQARRLGWGDILDIPNTEK